MSNSQYSGIWLGPDGAYGQVVSSDSIVMEVLTPKPYDATPAMNVPEGNFDKVTMHLLFVDGIGQPRAAWTPADKDHAWARAELDRLGIHK